MGMLILHESFGVKMNELFVLILGFINCWSTWKGL